MFQDVVGTALQLIYCCLNDYVKMLLLLSLDSCTMYRTVWKQKIRTFINTVKGTSRHATTCTPLIVPAAACISRSVTAVSGRVPFWDTVTVIHWQVHWPWKNIQTYLCLAFTWNTCTTPHRNQRLQYNGKGVKIYYILWRMVSNKERKGKEKLVQRKV